MLLAYGPEVLLTGHKGPLSVTRDDLESIPALVAGGRRDLARARGDARRDRLRARSEVVTVDPYQAAGERANPFSSRSASAITTTTTPMPRSRS